MAYQVGQKVDVVVSKERGGFCVQTKRGEITRLDEESSKATVKLADGTTKRVAFSKIQAVA